MLEAVSITVLASLLTAFFLRATGIPSEIDSHDDRVRRLNRDLRRWIRDRDMDLDVELARIGNTGAAAGQLYAGSLPRQLAAAQERALQEWRDEATRAMDEFKALAEREGRLHQIERRRRHHALPEQPPRLEFPDLAFDILSRWRVDATPGAPGTATHPVDDTTARELEAELREFEDRGYLAWPTRSVLTRRPTAQLRGACIAPGRGVRWLRHHVDGPGDGPKSAPGPWHQEIKS